MFLTSVALLLTQPSSLSRSSKAFVVAAAFVNWTTEATSTVETSVNWPSMF